MEAIEEFDSTSLVVVLLVGASSVYVRVFYLFCGRLLASGGGDGGRKTTSLYGSSLPPRLAVSVQLRTGTD